MRVTPGRSIPKPSPRNLRYFSHTPIARRAINAIKNPIAMLEWEIAPRAAISRNAEIDRQIEIVRDCLAAPNNDDSFRTLVEQVLEDVMCGAGAIEKQLSGDEIRPLWMWPIDGLSVQVYPGWTGTKNEARYAQVIGQGTYSGSSERIDLRNDEMIYIRPNPNSATPFGFGPLEIAFMDIARLLAAGEFAGNVAGNQRSSILLDLGDVPQEDVAAFRTYWQNEIEGMGKVPIVGFPGAPGDAKSRGIGINRLYPEGDSGLFLKYQEFLIRVIASAFDLSPQNLSVEADVNRNTSEVANDRDWNHAIKPMADLISSHLNREVIQGALGFHQIEFRWKGLDREDEMATAEIAEKYYRCSVLTPNEIREKIGKEKLNSPWADKVFADVEIAKIAARGVAKLEDPALPDGSNNPVRLKRRSDPQLPSPKLVASYRALEQVLTTDYQEL